MIKALAFLQDLDHNGNGGGAEMLRIREPVNGFTHLGGVALSILGLVVLLVASARLLSALHIASFAIYGASLILLYTASSLYHLLPLRPRGVALLRRIDHMMIFVLIAGTYTPICLIALRGPWGLGLLIAAWMLAVLGIILKAAWPGAPRLLSTLFYLTMGWLVVVAFPPLLRGIPAGAVAWLAGGGALYSIGAALYALKWPKGIRGFGFHEIFHLFVLGGSFCHFWMMFRYILFL
jgi:hemolysin III